jgi:hypothetical protein
VISVAEYYMGRDKKYPLNDTLRANAEELVEKVNQLLSRFGEGRRVSSGWRPPQVNAATPGAAKRSLHMTCEAVDLEDSSLVSPPNCPPEIGEKGVFSMIKMRSVLALLVVVGFFTILGIMITGVFVIFDNPTMTMMFGSLTTTFGTVVGWYFGSSAGSDRKTEMLTKERQ